MRLHRLELTAFGPYPGTVELDLDALTGDGLFLLHGQTGAGKTSLLDAVAFALFGRVPGVRNEAKRLRSDTAAPHTRTQVQLEFSVGPVRAVISRNPEYLRPKSRGTGETLERHRVVLRWVGVGPAGFPTDGLTRADEVGDVIRDLLGMSADQFFQVVLLPQSDFARFLRADTADREDLLERLFDTGRFGNVEDWFATARRDSRAELATYTEAVDVQVARLVEAAGQTAVPARADLEWLAAVRDRAADRAALCADVAAVAREDRRSTALARDRAVDSARRHQQYLDLRRDLADVERAAPLREQNARDIASAERAAPVLAAMAAADDLRVTAERSSRTAEACSARYLAVAGEPGPTADLDVEPDVDLDDGVEPQGRLDDLRRRAAADRDLAGSLTRLVTEAAEQAADEAAASAAERRRTNSVVALASIDARVAAFPAIREDLRRRCSVAAAAGQRLPERRRRLAELRTQLAAVARIPELATSAEAARARAADAVDAHQAAVDRRQHLTARRIAGMAAELANGLGAGERCPVCGATEHPAPAGGGHEAVAPADLRRAEADEHAALIGRSSATAAAAAAVAEVAAARAAAVDVTADTLAAEIDELVAAVDRDELAAADAAAAELAAAADQQHDTDLAERDRMLADLATATAELEATRARLSRRAVTLRDAAAGFGTVGERRDHLLDRAAAAEAFAAALEAAVVSRRAAGRATHQVTELAIVAGFPDAPAAARASRLDLDQLRRDVHAHDVRRAELLGRMAANGLDAGSSPADQASNAHGSADSAAGHVPVEAAEAAAAASAAASVAARDAASSAADAADAAVSAADAAQARRTQVDVAARRVVAAWQAREPVAAADAEITALADVIAGRGQNHRAMSLRAYVLGAKLAEVAAAASLRLDRMSAGRYTFVTSLVRESRGRSGGLGLDVVDAWSGRQRPTRTLSGGETFLASLALALGLSDVVAAHSGGRPLDTLFIDEGFGTLDADTLELVMTTLDELRAGGRIVGVVSHVDELRQRIPSRLQVSRGPSGSTVTPDVA